MMYPCECGGAVVVRKGRGTAESAACQMCHAYVSLDTLLREAAPIAARRIAKTKAPGEIRALVSELTGVGGEVFSGSVWRAWRDKGGERDKRRGVKSVQTVLASMEADGLLESRIVQPDEHKGSQWVRRYFRAVPGA